MRDQLSVLQIPEICDWNPYVAAAASALTARGIAVLSPALCRDLVRHDADASGSENVAEIRPSVVHLHWPEKLVRQLGTDAAAETLSGLAGRGARIVQTIHNVSAHEPSAELDRFQRFVDGLTHGVHVFSPAHERAVRRDRPGLPEAVLHLAHPQFPAPAQRWPAPPHRSVGCLGRLRKYKRVAQFAWAFLEAAGPDARLLVAGEPEERRIDHELRALAANDPRLEYRAGFVDEQEFWRHLASVEWIALPYPQVYSSGVLVAALQMRRRILSPTPVGGLDLYGRDPGDGSWVTLDPWDEARAVAAWLRAVDEPPAPAPESVGPTWETAAEALITFYRQLPAVGGRSSALRSQATKGDTPMVTPSPVLARYTTGEPFEFGTHANDFLVSREQTLATETFVVRVPGLGRVPEHLHTDMEQTFVFLSGVGEATLTDGSRPPVTHICLPGDMLFVPSGWRHTVVAKTIEGVVYLTVNAFLPDAERIGDSAIAHAAIAQAGFQTSDGTDPATTTPAQQLDPLSVFRTAETAFVADQATARFWPQDFPSPHATLTREPSSYRVRRIGPFEYVKPVSPSPRVLTADLADALFDAVGGRLPVYVEGSQSPISVKQPCAESDVDILLAVESAEQLGLVNDTLDALKLLEHQMPVPMSLGVVHIGWLRLPNFYTALSLDPASLDRRWWTAPEADRLQEAARRVRDGVAILGDLAALHGLLTRSLAVAGRDDETVDELRVIPRWRGYV